MRLPMEMRRRLEAQKRSAIGKKSMEKTLFLEQTAMPDWDGFMKNQGMLAIGIILMKMRDGKQAGIWTTAMATSTIWMEWGRW